MTSTVWALVAWSCLGASGFDGRWPEQVLPLRKGSLEIGLGLGPTVTWVGSVPSSVGIADASSFDSASTLRLGITDGLELYPAWLRARVTPADQRGGLLVSGGLAGFGLSSSTRTVLFQPALAVEGFLRGDAFVAVLGAKAGMTVGTQGGLAVTGVFFGTTSLTLLTRLTERWVLLTTLSVQLAGLGDRVSVEPALVVKGRVHLAPAWAIDLWFRATERSFTPGLSLFFAPSGLF